MQTGRCPRRPFQAATTHLQQLLQKRNAIRPFVYVVKRVEALFDLLRVLFVLWVGRVGLLSGS